MGAVIAAAAAELPLDAPAGARGSHLASGASDLCPVLPAAPAAAAREFRPRLGVYLELSKYRLSLLVLLTTAAGYVVGSPSGMDWPGLAAVLLGTTLAAFGANALNQCMEADRDARMIRTRGRPLPSGRLTPRAAWTYSVFIGAAGPAFLWAAVGALPAALALLCELIYVALYTPLKARSTLNTLVGAVVGAIPPLIGWAAAESGLSGGAWALAAILFVWQIPHFLALAWMYREDYARGGYCMLPILDADGEITFRTILLHSIALAPVTIMLTATGATGWAYACGALGLSALLIVPSAQLYRQRSESAARRVFLASVVYLPLLLALMALDRPPAERLYAPPTTRTHATPTLAAGWSDGR
jgi:protoheme IX farnesyltransferase